MKHSRHLFPGMHLLLLAFVLLQIVPAFLPGDRLPRLELSDADSLAFRQWFLAGDSLLKAEKYDSALVCYRRAEAVAGRRGNDSLRLLLDAALAHVKGNLLVGREQLDSARLEFERAEAGHLRLGRWEKATMAQLDQALISYFSGDMHRMEEGLERATESARNLPISHDYQGSILGLKSVLYNQTGDYDRAIEVARKEVELARAQEEPDTAGLATMYNNLGVYYDNKGDYDRAIGYYLASLQLDKNGRDGGAGKLNNLSVSYSNKGLYEKALYYNQQQLDALHRTTTAGESPKEFRGAYSNRGSFFLRTEDYDSAVVYLQRALELDRVIGTPYPYIYNSLGVLYRKRDEFGKAIPFTEQAIGFFRQRFGAGHPMVALAYRNLGQIYDRQGNFPDALANYQQALLILAPSFTDTSYLANPELNDFTSPVDLLKTLRDKGRAMARWAEENQDLVLQEGALNTLQRAIDLVDSLRNEYQEDSQQFWNEEVRPLFESAIYLAEQLYRSTGEQQYLETAFRFAEKSKASLLAAAVQESAARRTAGIPDDLLQQEKALKLDMAFYREKVFREQQKGGEADTAKILLWQRKILERRQDYDQLLAGLERDYPTYFQLKYRETTPTVAGLQQALPAESTLLEYFWGEDRIFIFAVSRQEAALYSFAPEAAFADDLAAFLGQVSDRDRVAEEGLSAAMFREFTGGASRLYASLLQPVLPAPAGQLIVIPDGRLGYLPFELLLTKAPPEGGQVDYGALPYLLKQSRIRYEYSVSLLLKPAAPNRARSRFAGFAPTYGNDLQALARDARIFCEDARTVGFGNLSNNQAEVTGVAALWRGKAFQAAAATEAAFKESASRYRLLHLAMHGFVNQCDPLYSGLVFAQQNGGASAATRSGESDVDSLALPPGELSLASADDGFLHAYEIYNMQLNAELAVLSACNTGVGRLARGEGVMSLARAFKYAGCPNIVTSLWQADDAATAQIMQQFYTYLKDGVSKDQALRQAKLDYLAANRRNHPFFWGTFVLIGDDRPIGGGGSVSRFFLLGLLALGLGGVILWWWRRG